MGVQSRTEGMWAKKVENKAYTTPGTAAVELLKKEVKPSISSLTILHQEEKQVVLGNQAMAGNQTRLKAFAAQLLLLRPTFV